MSFKIGKRFEIFRSNETVEPGERVPIILGVGRAFGSGDHETTTGCLEELENIPIIKNAKVLDVGCGTGILSIAAIKMGAGFVTAFDPDPNAVSVTTDSIRLNNMEGKIIPLEGTLDMVDEKNFDIIMANLYGDILLKLADGISKRLKPGGYLLLSGILYEYNYDVKTAFVKRGCDILKERYHDEYTTQLLRNKI